MPDIEKEAEELAKQLEAELAGEDADDADDAVDEGEEEQAEDAKGDEGKPDDKSGTDEKAEAKPADDEKKASPNSEAARKRREEAKARKDAAAKPKEEAKTETKADAKTVDDPEPEDKESVAHAKWETRQLAKQLKAIEERAGAKDPDVEAVKQERIINAAAQEFNGFVGTFQKEAPDAAEAINHVRRTIAAGIKALNPRMTDAELIRRADLHVLNMARQALSDGYANPASAIYDAAFEHYGYAPKAEEKAADKAEDGKKAEEKKKPSLDKLEDVKKKSTSASTAGGRSTKAKSTPRWDDLSIDEYEKLSPEEREELVVEAA